MLTDKDLSDAFARGIFIAMLGFGMMQDYMGLEDYVAYVRSDWYQLTWWYWLVPILLLLVWHLLVMHKAKMMAADTWKGSMRTVTITKRNNDS